MDDSKNSKGKKYQYLEGMMNQKNSTFNDVSHNGNKNDNKNDNIGGKPRATYDTYKL